MLNLTDLAHELQEQTAWQQTPELLTDSQYLGMIVRGVKRLFIDTGRAKSYNAMLYTTLDDGTYNYNGTFLIDEEEYIKLCAKIEFFRKVQSDVNNIVSYSTDALSVTKADKPYENLQNTLGDLENERRILYYKMVRYTIGDS